MPFDPAFKKEVDAANTAPLHQYEPGLYYDFTNYIPIQPMEFWTPITEKSVPGIRPGYWISTMGRVYDQATNTILQQQITGKGYLSIAFENTMGSHIRRMIHRISIIEFYGFDPERDMVDHISPFKRNNCIMNLRWATNAENLQYAADNGLCSGQSGVSVSAELVHHICAMMQAGRPRSEIYQYMRDSGVAYPSSLFDTIYSRKAWYDISCQYRLADYRERRSNFTDDEIHQICKLLESNPSIKFVDVLKSLGIERDELDDRTWRKLSTAISHIKNGREHTDISSQYNLTPAPRSHNLTPDQVHYACKRMEEGANNQTILMELGMITPTMTQREKVPFYGVLNHIRYRQCYYEIAKNYNIPFKK